MESLTLETHNLSIALNGSKEVVTDVCLYVSRGEIVGLSGPSGSGKSLTLWSLMGLLPAVALMSGGFKVYNAEGDCFDIQSASEARTLCGREVVMIPQNPFTSLNPVLRCGDQIAEAASLDERRNGTDRRRIVDHIAQFGFEDPERIYDAYPFELSGGQLQRVVVAMATIADPALILADEPTTALDVKTQQEVLNVLSAWVKTTGKSLLLVSHDTSVLKQYCHRIYEFHLGAVTEMLEDSSISIDNSSQLPDKQIIVDEEICTFKNISVRFRSRSGKTIQALDNVSFSLYQNEILGIIGSTGSGKSTIAKVLSGLVTPHHGSVECMGKPLDFRRFPALRRTIQMVFQDPYSALYPHWTAGAYLREGLRLHQIVPRSDEDELIRQILEDVGLTAEMTARYPHQLSGGERQRMQIARAILVKPDILICDEITSGLDAHIQEQILQLLTRLHSTYAVSIIFISHDLSVVKRQAHRVLVLEQGKVVDSGPTSRILADHARREIRPGQQKT
jgi:ABC-type glutathione transport system ATPase component